MKNEKEIDILARTIYGESKDKTLIGKEAIARVVLNRISKSINLGKDIEEVCKKEGQFKCWDKKSDAYKKIIVLDETNEVFSLCKRVAMKAVSGIMKDFLYGATHYHHKDNTPKWANGKIPCLIVGDVHFFNDIL